MGVGGVPQVLEYLWSLEFNPSTTQKKVKIWKAIQKTGILCLDDSEPH
jgi:hypothetical protein